MLHRARRASRAGRPARGGPARQRRRGAGAQPPERLRDAAVQRAPRVLGQLAVQHLAHQRVAEAALARALAPARRPGRPRRGARPDAGRVPPGGRRPAAPARARRRPRPPARAAARVSAAHPVQALADHVAHAVGTTPPVIASAPCSPAGGPSPRGTAGCPGCCRRCAPRRRGVQRPDARLPAAAPPPARSRRAQRQRRPLAGDRATAARSTAGVVAGLDVAVAGQQQQPHRAQLARQEVQQQQRRLVGGVQVVEHQQQPVRAAPPRAPGATARHSRKRASLAAAGAAPRRRRRSRARSSGTISASSDAPSPTQRASAASSSRARQLRQRIQPRPVRGRAPRLPAASPQHGAVRARRPARRLVGQPGLADARLARQQEEPPPPRHRAVQRGADLRQLALAPDEHGGSSSDGQNETEASR